MTWFRLDDQGAFHAKVIAVGNEAYGAWCRAGQWSSDHLTDGRIPTATAHLIASRRVWRRLVETIPPGHTTGLATQTEGGYEIHDYLVYNPSAKEVRADREARSEVKRNAGRQGGLASGQARAAKQRRSRGEAEPQAAAKQNEAPVPVPVPVPVPESRCDPAGASGPAEGSGLGPPAWFLSAAGTVEMGTGIDIDRRSAWLRYEGHRAQKGIKPTEGDARYWLTTVLGREASQDRERRREQGLELPARKPAAAPEPEVYYPPPTPEEAAELERALANLGNPPPEAKSGARAAVGEDHTPAERAALEAKRQAAIALLRAEAVADAREAS